MTDKLGVLTEEKYIEVVRKQTLKIPTFETFLALKDKYYKNIKPHVLRGIYPIVSFTNSFTNYDSFYFFYFNPTDNTLVFTMEYESHENFNVEKLELSEQNYNKICNIIPMNFLAGGD